MPDPYFNEPGYEIHRGTAEGRRRSREYDDAIHLHTISLAMLAHLEQGAPRGFDDVVRRHFGVLTEPLLGLCTTWARSATTAEMRAEISTATDALRRALKRLSLP